MKLAGRVAIVTGTSPNIGGGIAESLAAAGAAIVAVDAREENAAACARAIEKAGGRAIGITCDVTSEDDVARAIAATCNTFGTVDILVNNATIYNKQGLMDMSFPDWRKQTDILLDGTFLFSKLAAQVMIPLRRGVIINIVSTAGHQGEPGNIAYSTAKSGILNFTRSTAMELARYSIRVVNLTPTATSVEEMFERAERWGVPAPDPAPLRAIMEPFRQRIPMQKLPGPSDYGAAAVFLASDDAAFITGSDLAVDAGALARYWAWQPQDQR